MALSGVNNITLDSRGQVKSMIEWEATQSINNNSSTITVNVYYYFMYAIYAGASLSIVGNIAGQTETKSNSIGNHANGVKKLMATFTKTVSHDDLGKLTARIRVTAPFRVTYAGQYINQANHDFNITLNNIDRESEVSVPKNVTIPTTKPTVTITAKNSAFRNIADLEVNGKKIMTLNDLKGGTHTFNLSTAQEDEILSIMKNTDSMEYSVVISTWNDGTRIGGYPRAKGTFNVASNIKPVINSVTQSEANADLANKDLTIYVQDMSRVRVQTDASGARGSTIKSIEVNVEGRKYTGADITTAVVNVANPASGQWSAVITVTDTRDRTTTQTITKPLEVYYEPTITDITPLVRVRADYSSGYLQYVKDPENGVLIHGAMTFNVTPLGNRNYPWNVIAEAQQTGSTAWDFVYEEGIDHPDTYLFSWGGRMENDPMFTYEFDTLYSYVLRITITDTITQQVFLFNIPSGFTIMDYHNSGRGVAIGKQSEKEAFEVAMDAEFSGKVQSKDAITIYAPTENATDNILQRFRRKDGTTHSAFMYNEDDQALYLQLYGRDGWKTYFTFKDDGTILAGGKKVLTEKSFIQFMVGAGNSANHTMSWSTAYTSKEVNVSRNKVISGDAFTRDGNKVKINRDCNIEITYNVYLAGSNYNALTGAIKNQNDETQAQWVGTMPTGGFQYFSCTAVIEAKANDRYYPIIAGQYGGQTTTVRWETAFIVKEI